MTGVDVSFVYGWGRSGDLPHFRVGRAVKIPVAGLTAFIERISGLVDVDGGVPYTEVR